MRGSALCEWMLCLRSVPSEYGSRVNMGLCEADAGSVASVG